MVHNSSMISISCCSTVNLNSKSSASALAVASTTGVQLGRSSPILDWGLRVACCCFIAKSRRAKEQRPPSSDKTTPERHGDCEGWYPRRGSRAGDWNSFSTTGVEKLKMVGLKEHDSLLVRPGTPHKFSSICKLGNWRVPSPPITVSMNSSMCYYQSIRRSYGLPALLREKMLQIVKLRRNIQLLSLSLVMLIDLWSITWRVTWFHQNRGMKQQRCSN